MSSSPTQVRTAEQLLIEAVPALDDGRVLCTSLGRAQLAAHVARQCPAVRTTCHFLDVYQARQAREALAAESVAVEVCCQPDFPAEPVDMVLLPLRFDGEAELARDWMQQGHQALSVGGRMFVSTDNPRDRWLHEQMQALFDAVERRPADSGVVYAATKTAPLKKCKDFRCQFVFRDAEHLIRAVSRPGVFAHRRVDSGARALLRAMQIHDGERVVDMGCGSGAIALSAALRADDVRVLAIDANARAVACVEEAAAANGLRTIATLLDDAGRIAEPGTFDLLVGNPPYYSDFQIAALFVDTASRALRPGGRLLLVTKSPAWYAEHLPERFDAVEIEASKEYHVVRAVQPG